MLCWRRGLAWLDRWSLPRVGAHMRIAAMASCARARSGVYKVVVPGATLYVAGHGLSSSTSTSIRSPGTSSGVIVRRCGGRTGAHGRRCCLAQAEHDFDATPSWSPPLSTSGRRGGGQWSVQIPVAAESNIADRLAETTARRSWSRVSMRTLAGPRQSGSGAPPSSTFATRARWPSGLSCAGRIFVGARLR